MDKNLTILVDFDHTLFNTTKFVEFMSGSPKTIDYKDFLYPDALEFVNYASDFGNLTLFSEGEVDFQKEKIDGTGIGGLFSGGVRIFPSYSKMQDLASIATVKKTVLIDDKPEVVDNAISLGCHVIRVKRGKYSDKETKSKPDFVVNSLSEVVEKDILRSI
jgi:hypothetical protein